MMPVQVPSLHKMRSEKSYIFNPPPPLINEEYHISSKELYITGNPIPSLVMRSKIQCFSIPPSWVLKIIDSRKVNLIKAYQFW
jgi:hypothetical protein